MRQQNLCSLAVRIVSAAALLLLAGCATWTNWTAPKTATLQNVQDDLTYAQLKARDTRQALEELLFADQADLPAAYKSFAAKLNLMEGAGNRLTQNANGLIYRGNSYLVEAEASAGQCRYPRLSRSAGMPTLILGDAFDPIAEQSAHVQRAYRAFESDLTAVKMHLSRRLTEQGVRDMAMFIRKGETDGESLSYSLDQAMAAVAKAKAAYEMTAQEREAARLQGQPAAQGKP